MISRVLVLATLAVLTACSGPRETGLAPGTQVVAGDLPAPSKSDLFSASTPYYLGPFDELRIEVFGVDELQRDVQIDASGRLSFPLVGVVEAAGLTPAELANEFEARLRGRYVRDPQVTVNLKETVSQVITVDGQVAKPGLYPVVGKMTLMRAVARSGGTSEFAKLDDVLIFREVEGQQMVGVYNLQAIRRGNYADPLVYANDVIMVGDSPSRRLFKDIVQGSSLITTPLIILLRRN